MAKKALSQETLKFLVASSLKKDKFVVQSAAANKEGDGIDFVAVSDSGFIRVHGSLRDPQEEMPLETDPDDDDVPLAS